LEGQDLIADVISEGHAKRHARDSLGFEFGFNGAAFSDLGPQNTPPGSLSGEDGSRTSNQRAGEVVLAESIQG